MIVFEQVSKSFGPLALFRDLSLAVKSGEILGIVGPSGSGKTTILKMITGLVAPDKGTVTVGAGPVGYVFQEPRLLPWRSALDNVAVPLRGLGMEKGVARTKAASWLERVGLAGFERYRPSELSGGMAQRVSIARALALEPAVLLMDEPLGNVDLDLKASLLDLLDRMFQERKTTVVYVTHELTEVLRLADRIVEITDDRSLRELDLSDRVAVAREWMSQALGTLRAEL